MPLKYPVRIKNIIPNARGILLSIELFPFFDFSISPPISYLSFFIFLSCGSILFIIFCAVAEPFVQP